MMSKDSSDTVVADQTEHHSPKSWRIALIVLFATIGLFFLAEIIGDLIISLYPLSQHWSAIRANNCHTILHFIHYCRGYFDISNTQFKH
jgi:hypothetical protein